MTIAFILLALALVVVAVRGARTEARLRQLERRSCPGVTFTRSETSPLNPKVGDLWSPPSQYTLYVYTGVVWVFLAEPRLDEASLRKTIERHERQYHSKR